MRIPPSFKLCFPYRCHLSPLAFKIFSFEKLKIFSEIWLWCVGVDFFVFILEFAQLFESVEWVILLNWKFLAIISLSTFLVLLSFFSSSGPPMTQMLDLFSQSHRPMKLCSFSFPIYFLLMFRVGNFYCSIFQFIDYFPVLSILLVSQSTAFCKSIIVFFSYIISICFSFISFTSWLRFFFSICAYNCLLKHFYDGYSNIFVR